MLFPTHILVAYWVDDFISTISIINRLPTKVLEITLPFELLYSRMLNYGNFHTFGCQVYPYLCAYSTHKLPHEAFLVSSLVIILNTRVTNVLIRLPLMCTSFIMHCFMRAFFLLLAPPLTMTSLN